MFKLKRAAGEVSLKDALEEIDRLNNSIKQLSNELDLERYNTRVESIKNIGFDCYSMFSYLGFSCVITGFGNLGFDNVFYQFSSNGEINGDSLGFDEFIGLCKSGAITKTEKKEG